MELNTLAETLRFFFIILAELVVLFIGISFLVGLLQEYVPASTIRRILAGRRGQGNVMGATLGALTPFCSCSTVPITVGLLNAGAPFGATMSFLLASPLVNPVILGLFLVTFGWRITTLYAVICFFLAVILGAVWERIGLAAYVRRVRVIGGHESPDGPTDVRSRMRRAFAGAWTQFRSVLPYLVIGVAIGSFIYGFVPSDWIVRVAGSQNPAAIPVAAAIGIPLYIRVETMVPIAAVLLQKGMSLGAIMALIIGGAGVSIPEVSLLASIFKPRLLSAFVLTILVVAVVAGYTVSIMFV
jgi:uncharacterized membrane protein YraQ (UPF0718 family)